MPIGWIDFSKDERNKVLNVIHLLDEPGAVDELGIGAVRDAFADLFFPGTSTVQTRAKYFLIVPYVLMEAGSGKYGSDLNTILRKIDNEERSCRDILIKTSNDGVIGSLVPRSWVLRTPSNIYWNGIKRMGIFKEDLSVKEYIHQSIIQRMRELALQSANDTLTTNDRLEIQKEVEQLKDQVDTISQTTEFNTKKLLNGNQSALISTSSEVIKGFVTGEVGAGGDYNVELKTLEGGVSQMQNSQIFRDRNTGALASGGTKLEDIEAFYGDSGEFCLNTPQTLTISGNGTNTTIKVDRLMTLNELAASLQNAIGSSSGLGMENSRAQVMTTDTTGENYNGGNNFWFYW